MPKKQKLGTGLVAKEGEKGRIGSLIIFGFGSMEVPFDKTERWYKDQSLLKKKHMPSKPTPVEAFQNTCSKENVEIWQGIYEPNLEEYESMFGEKVGIEYLTLRSPTTANEYILERRIWRMQTEELVTPEHPNVARLRFNMGADRIDVIPFDGYNDADLIRDITDIANDEYQRQKEVVNSTRHRQALYRILREFSGVHFLGCNSTWFIPIDGEKFVYAYKQYLDEVASQHKTSMYPTEMRTIDVVDERQMKEDIARDVQREVQQAYEKLLDDTLQYLAKQKKDAKEELVERSLETRLKNLKKLGVLKEEYENLLGMKIKIAKRKASSKSPVVRGRIKALLESIADF